MIVTKTESLGGAPEEESSKYSDYTQSENDDEA